MNNKIILLINSDDSNKQRIEESSKMLVKKISELKIGKTEFGRKLSDKGGVKGLTNFDLSSILITLSGSGTLITLIKLLNDFLKRNERIEINIKDGDRELSIKGGSIKEREKLLNKFFEKDVEV